MVGGRKKQVANEGAALALKRDFVETRTQFKVFLYEELIGRLHRAVRFDSVIAYVTTEKCDTA